MDAVLPDRSQSVVVPGGGVHHRGAHRAAALILAVVLLAGCTSTAAEGDRLVSLSGLCGLVWVGEDSFVAVRSTADGGAQLFAGTDDEHYGGILRPLPAAP